MLTVPPGKEIGSGGQAALDWTSEEEDTLIMLYTKHQDDPDFIRIITTKLEELGIKKSREEVGHSVFV